MKQISINPQCQFIADLNNTDKVTMMNGKAMPIAVWNLLLSIRDCGLYAKGIKPHRNWRITDVKTYFGIKGSADKLHQQLVAIRSILMEEVSNG